MERSNENLDESQVRQLPTGELIRHALEETRLLARAELLHAKEELREEIRAAKVGGILAGAAGVIAIVGVTVLFVAIAMALPMPEPLAAVLVGAVLLVGAAVCAFIGAKRLPRKPLPRTQERVRKDLEITREQLQ